MKRTPEQQIVYRQQASQRRARRTIKHRQNQKQRGKECPECGGVMSWCSGCEVWSRTCCEDYGTCQCS